MELLFIIIILIFSAILHEIAHGAVAYHLGDSTAKYAGRLTLNPLKHLDPVGSVILPIFLIILTRVTGSGIIFGWAKPVPINPYNFKDQKYGQAKVALAGPAINLIVALLFGLLLRFIIIPAGIAVNLLSPPFGFGGAIAAIVYINILLAVFNLLPIPPLDGSHILFTFLPYSIQHIKVFLSQFGYFIIIIFIVFFFSWLSFIINLIFKLITGFSLF